MNLRRVTGLLFVISLIGVVIFFYAFSADSLSGRAILFAYVLTVSIDGLIIGIHLLLRQPKKQLVGFDPDKLTILIICYNGADVIEKTIRQALVHVPPQQIIVVSDNSSDNTDALASAMGVRVFRNYRNLNKSMSINHYIRYVTTPYTLILDDDTLIGQTFIPTSLLDDGFAAVAFNVMPIPAKNLANRFQSFEYRKSMVIRKGLKATMGAVNNVSGAIGLFHTEDLIRQSHRHSGQYGGEDQQRTILAQLESIRRGVTYSPSTVYTLAPPTLRAVFKQRAFKWGTATHENFLLMIRSLWHPRIHPLMKLEETYSLFVLLTEPFRVIFFLLVLFAPAGSFAAHILRLTLFYIVIEVCAWLKMGRKDPLWVVILFPLYAKYLSAARFTAHFYWLKKKYIYTYKNRFHRYILSRRLLAEYGITLAILSGIWVFAAIKLYQLVRSTPDIQSFNLHVPYVRSVTGTLQAMQPIWIVAAVLLVIFLSRIIPKILKPSQPPRSLAFIESDNVTL